MTSNSRYIRARVVDFSGPEFAGEIAGPKGGGDKKLRFKLRRARALKRRIANLSDKHPIGWKLQLRTAKKRLRIVMADLRALGWKPKKASRARKPGEDDMDAALDDIPEAEPGETEETDAELEALPDEPDDRTEGEQNWLDAHVGVEPRLIVAPQVKQRGKPLLPVGKVFKDAAAKAAQLVRGGWRPFDHLGASARIQTRSGQSAMITTVNPGLFIVQIVSDEAAHKIAGDNIGILPLLLYPMVKNQIQKLVAPKQPPAPVQPGQPAAAAPPAPASDTSGVGCDCKDKR